MVKRVSEAEWRGDLKSGEGDLALGSGAFKGAYSYKSRFESGAGTNPEELLAAMSDDVRRTREVLGV